MNVKTRGRGRPRIDPSGAASFQLGLRLPVVLRDKLMFLVERANERARRAGVPATVNAPALIRMWIEERVKAEEMMAAAVPATSTAVATTAATSTSARSKTAYDHLLADTLGPDAAEGSHKGRVKKKAGKASGRRRSR